MILENAPLAEQLHRRQDRVVLDVEDHIQTEASALIRNEAEAVADGLEGRFVVYALALVIDLAACDLMAAEDRLHKLRLARAQQSGKADDLARAHIQIHIAERLGRGQIAHLEQHVAKVFIDRRIDVGQLAADDHLDQLILVDVRNSAGAVETAVAEDGIGIAALEDLVQTVRDIDDADAAARQELDDAENVLDILFLQHGGQLVEDDDLRIVHDRLGQLDQLLFCRAQMLDGHVQVDIALQKFHDLRRAAVKRLPVDENTRFLFIPADKQIFHTRHVLHQGEFLMNDRDAAALRLPDAIASGVDFFTLDIELALCHPVFAGDAFGEC